MARVRGRGNKSTEEKLARLFRQSGIKGWRRHLPLPGTPDFAFPRERLAIFVDGCFMHGCPRHATFPATRRNFWLQKFATNQARDRRVSRELRRRGWHVVHVWEHELKKPARVLARIRRALAAA
jgi:DNA mismatch endonuclease, patch repair protein